MFLSLFDPQSEEIAFRELSIEKNSRTEMLPGKEIAFRELSIEKNSRTEMLPGKRDFYLCCRARRSATYK